MMAVAMARIVAMIPNAITSVFCSPSWLESGMTGTDVTRVGEALDDPVDSLLSAAVVIAFGLAGFRFAITLDGW